MCRDSCLSSAETPISVLRRSCFSGAGTLGSVLQGLLSRGGEILVSDTRLRHSCLGHSCLRNSCLSGAEIFSPWSENSGSSGADSLSKLAEMTFLLIFNAGALESGWANFSVRIAP